MKMTNLIDCKYFARMSTFGSPSSWQVLASIWVRKSSISSSLDSSPDTPASSSINAHC